MALNDDPDLDFDVAASIDRYLPWEGVYGDRTVTQLVSNTAGIPGLGSIGEYGPHICQYLAIGTLESCAQIIYTNELENSSAPGTGFDYGGSQWQLAGAIAEQVTNSTWNQAFDAYIGEPCDLEVFTYGNMWTDIDTWTGHPDSLFGQDNPSIEGGAITNMRDYAKLLLLHLRDGRCGEQQVVSPESLAYMRENRGAEFGTNYGMGWWIIPGDNGAATVYDDPGAYGSISWIDLERGIGGYVGVDTYSPGFDNQVPAFVRSEIIALHQALVDEARAAAN
jgi:CubicO group peptidase (beta-lactamase class C family)